MHATTLACECIVRVCGGKKGCTFILKRHSNHFRLIVSASHLGLPERASKENVFCHLVDFLNSINIHTEWLPDRRGQSSEDAKVL